MGRVNYNPQQYNPQRPYPPQAPQYRPYPPQAQPAYIQPKPASEVSVGKWLGSLLLLMIPVVNVICFFYWLFGGGNCRPRTNFIRASFILTLIISVIAGIIFAILTIALGMSLAELTNSFLAA